MIEASTARKEWANESLAAFCCALASGDPAPGGGSAAAYAGAMSAALVAMVARTTLGRKSYAGRHEEMMALLERAEALRSQLLALASEDASAYAALIAARRLFRGGNATDPGPLAALQQSLRHAAEVPLATAEACLQVMELAASAAERGNPNAGADAAMATRLAHAALTGSAHNARVNLLLLLDPAYVAELEPRVREVEQAGIDRVSDATRAWTERA